MLFPVPWVFGFCVAACICLFVRFDFLIWKIYEMFWRGGEVFLAGHVNTIRGLRESDISHGSEAEVLPVREKPHCCHDKGFFL